MPVVMKKCWDFLDSADPNMALRVKLLFADQHDISELKVILLAGDVLGKNFGVPYFFKIFWLKAGKT